MARSAVFLDRDGVLTEPVWNPATAAYESAHRVGDVRLCADIVEPLRSLRAAGFELFIVSNQPSYAKGKVALEDLRAIADEVRERLAAVGITFRDTYYCFHHPDGVLASHSGVCVCRKPEPYFLRRAAEQYDVDLARSWMIGDRDTDVECGRRAGCRTVLVAHPHAAQDAAASKPDDTARSLNEAAALIVHDLAGGAVASIAREESR